MNAFADWLGVEVTASGEGRAEVRLDAGEHHLNPAGTVHGGVLATLVDTAMGLAVRSAVSGPDAPATSQLSMAFLRPGRTGSLVGTAEVRKQGEHLLVCEAGVEQDGKALIQALATFALVSR